MQRKSLCKLVAAFFGILAFTVAASRGYADDPAQKPHKGVMKELREAHRILDEADRDYNGQRVAAVEQVHKAIVELEAANKEKHPGNPPKHPEKKHKDGGEAQSVSDGQLKHARQILQEVLPKLNKRHAKIAGHVADAVSEIDKALAIR